MLIPYHGYATLVPNEVAMSFVQRLGLPPTIAFRCFGTSKSTNLLEVREPISHRTLRGRSYNRLVDVLVKAMALRDASVPKFEIMRIQVLDRKRKPAMDRVSHAMSAGEGIVGEI
jgi:hypothetical protein